jgi:hypothetical protein
MPFPCNSNVAFFFITVLGVHTKGREGTVPSQMKGARPRTGKALLREIARLEGNLTSPRAKKKCTPTVLRIDSSWSTPVLSTEYSYSGVLVFRSTRSTEYLAKLVRGGGALAVLETQR